MQRLSDFLNPEETKQKVYELRNLKNSFKRNLINPSHILQKSHAQSECTSQIKQDQSKLSNHNFRSSDLKLLFTHLYGKQQMTTCDRNLIRKILLSVFTQSLILAAGKDLVRSANFMCLEKGETICMFNNFYFLLKGIISIQSNYYSKRYRGGDYFGHIEIMCKQRSNSEVLIESDCCILTINSSYFMNHLYQYFQQKIRVKSQLLPEIITANIEETRHHLIMQQMSPIIFDVGEKLIRKKEPVQHFLMVYEGQTSSQSPKTINSLRKLRLSTDCFGFAQYFSEQESFDSHIYAISRINAYKIDVSSLEKHMKPRLVMQIRMNLAEINNMSQLKRLREQEEKEQEKQIYNSKKFMRIRKVKLPFPKKLKTLQRSTRTNSTIDYDLSSSFLADFMFVKQKGGVRTQNRRQQQNMSLSKKISTEPNLAISSIMLFNEQ